MLRKLSRDPLFQKQTRADAVWGLVDLMDAARKAPEHLGATPPILYLYGAKDQIIPRAPTKPSPRNWAGAPRCANIRAAITCC